MWSVLIEGHIMYTRIMSAQIENIFSFQKFTGFIEFHFPHLNVWRETCVRKTNQDIKIWLKIVSIKIRLPLAAMNRPHWEIFADEVDDKQLSSRSRTVPFSVHRTMSVLLEQLIMNRPLQAMPKPTHRSPFRTLGKVIAVVGLTRKPSFLSTRITSMQCVRDLWISTAFESGLQANRTAWS